MQYKSYQLQRAESFIWSSHTGFPLHLALWVVSGTYKKKKKSPQPMWHNWWHKKEE